MPRWLSGWFVLALLLGASLTPAQEPAGKKNAEAKSPDEKKQSASKKSVVPPVSEPSPEITKDPPTPNPRDDIFPVPAGGKLWLTPEKFKELEDRYQKLRDKLSLLERQLKGDKNLPSACKLNGKLEGDSLVMRAEIVFATSAPQCLVFLGLKNGFLTDEGQIDDAVPHLEIADEGFLVRVDKEGTHRLTLNFRVPVGVKRAGSATSGNERGFDLGLPGSAVTTLTLELPQAVKEIRWNETASNPRNPGRWDLTLGAVKNLVVVWREPVAAPSAGPGTSAKANLKVKMDEGRVEIAGDLILEDGKGQTREWQLQLPPQIKVGVASGSPSFTWLPPDGKNSNHIIRLTDAADKVTLSLQAQNVRAGPQQKISIGPFLVVGTPVQGSILVQAAPGVLRGQRLLYHRFGEIIQHDPPKSPAGLENLAMFQFWNAISSAKGLSPNRASLELEWKMEKGQVEAVAEHDIKVREDEGQWLLDVETKFIVQSANSGLDFLDLQTPTVALPDLFWFAVQPAAAFPATLRWPAGLTPRFAFPLSLSAQDEGGPLELSAADGQRRVRLKLSRPIGKEMIVKTQTRSVLAGDATRFLVELPRLAGVLDRGGKVTVWAPSGQEFLLGPPGQQEPISEKYQQTLEQTPAMLELAWRGSRREKLASALVDIHVREQAIHIRQTLQIPAAAWSSGAVRTGQLGLRLPWRSFPFTVLNVPRLEQERSLAWVKLPDEIKGKYEIELEYDLPRATKDKSPLIVPILWPEGTTWKDAKVRVWTEPGTTPILVGNGDVWLDRPLEEASGRRSWPALVAVGSGVDVPVSLRLEETSGSRLPVFVAERTLTQVIVDEEGNQSYRMRCLVRKFTGSAFEVELPVSWEPAQPVVRVGGKDVGGVKVVDPLRNRLRVPLAPHLYPQPVLLEIDYQIPAAQTEGRRFWQTQFLPPRFVGDVFFGATRWQVALPGQQIPLVLGSANVDYRWSFRNWLLTPEPTMTYADLDAWIGATEPSDERTVSLTWWRGTLDAQRVYHFPRQLWLILCSGTVLFVGMLILLTPLPRVVLALLALVLGLGFVSVGLFHEYLLPVVFLGCQPALAVLIVVGVVHWLLQERTRRQLIFLPTFTRVPQGSTLVRTQPKPREMSTVDAPPLVLPGSTKGPAQ